MDIKHLLQQTLELNSSDLHLVAGAYPMVRVDGTLKPIPGTEVLTAEMLQTLVPQMLTQTQKEFFVQNKEIDFSLALGKQARFRVNAYIQRGAMSAALRLIPSRIRSIEELHLPKICYNLASLKSGLVLVTGPTGHGKSSTLAAMIEEINNSRFEHIVTIEDPIEYAYENKKSIVSQREIGQDSHSWKAALKSVLREDPDVVLIGEMRDYETISSALTIAETGHLVFATLHTNSASQTIDRIVDVFPAHQQNQIRMQLANALEAVLSQRLLPAINGGRVPVLEILLGTSAVKTNIREGKTHLIDNIIQTSKEAGMKPLEDSMIELINKGILSAEVAQMWSLRPNELMRALKAN
ncbi:MAG: type IV pilus twitching motility protein PilT [Patescibacteria group bacterium]